MNRLLIGILLLLLISAASVYIFRKQIRYQVKPKLRKERILIKPSNNDDDAVNVLLLHHSTGKRIWDGGVERWFSDFQKKTDKKIFITEQHFPFEHGNNPFDYWNIWVKHSGERPWFYEPTLEMITKQYNVVVFKHCFPVSNIKKGDGKGDPSSDEKNLENYKLQYNALRQKLLTFPKTKFILWTGAALVKEATTEERAKRAQTFFNWVRNDWNKPDDNIFLWDFYELETEGGLYLLDSYAEGVKNSHPNKNFSLKAAPLFCQRIVDVIENNGTTTEMTGQSKM